MGQAVVVSDLTDEELFRYTQNKRLALVDEMTAHKMPTDTSEQSILLSALNDLDKQVVTRQKLKLEEKAVDAASSMADTMDFLYKNFGNHSPLEREITGEVTRNVDLPDGPLTDVKLVEGELDIGSHRIELRDITGNDA